MPTSPPSLATLLILISLPNLSTGLASSQKLLDRGLTRREVECIEHRHRRRSRQKLTAEELDCTLLALDKLSLLPGQARHLLRSMPLPELRELCEAHTVWCSYRKTLCDCTSSALSMSMQTNPPSILAFDCEFKPLRFAAVDESGRVRFDGLVTSGTAVPPMPGVLSCDKPTIRRLDLTELQTELAALQAGGCTLVAHTPVRDLEAIGMPSLAVVDVGRLGLTTEAQTVSLQRMAARHLGLSIQKGGQAHCAVQDARVAMSLYQHLIAGVE